MARPIDRAVLTVLGGSGAFTPELIYALTRWTEGRPVLRVVLHGRDGEKLARVAAACRKLAAGAEPKIEVLTETDLGRALDGANFVLNQVRVGGLAARASDERFPHRLGLPGEETMGAGGFANALRTVPVAVEQGRAIRRWASQATVLNLTNPASIVSQALVRGWEEEAGHSAPPESCRVIGVCDGPVAMFAAAAAALERPVAALRFSYAGLNHFGWLLGVRDGNHDLMPLLLERLDRLPTHEISHAVIRAIGAIPNPYLRYLYHPERMLAAQQGKQARGAQLQAVEAALLDEYKRPEGLGRPEALARRGALWYHQVIVPLLDAICNDRQAVQVLNLANGTLLPWLPAAAVVEVPALIGRAGPRPLALEVPQPELRATIIAYATYELLLLEAIMRGSRPLALRALLANPFIPSATQAEALLDLIWPGGYPQGA